MLSSLPALLPPPIPMASPRVVGRVLDILGPYAQAAKGREAERQPEQGSRLILLLNLVRSARAFKSRSTGGNCA